MQTDRNQTKKEEVCMWQLIVGDFMLLACIYMLVFKVEQGNVPEKTNKIVFLILLVGIIGLVLIATV